MKRRGAAAKEPAKGESRFVAGAATPARIPAGTVTEIAIAGRSNVGKSSLLNRLTGRRSLARVGKTPGRTQQINFFAIGADLMLVDLPGYGFAKVPLPVKESWRRLIESYLSDREHLRGVVVLVDSRRGLSEEDRDLIDYLGSLEIPCCIAATKVDKLKRSERGKQLRELEELLPVHSVTPCSATTGEGIRELWGRIRSLAS